jgi:response regulator RpfG family c-di-GMP phosphodiesterase
LNHSQKNIYQRIKKRVILLLVLMTLTILGIIATSMAMASTLKTSSSVVNIFGRQRMYTQSIAKNASRTSVLYTTLNSEERIQEIDVLASKLDKTKEELLADRNAFETVLENLSNGFVDVDGETVVISARIMTTLADDVVELQNLWQPFSEAVVAIANSSDINVSFREALIFINENNETLLYHAQHVTNGFEAMIIDDYTHYRNLTYLLVGFLVLLAVGLVVLLYSYLFSALDVFYNEIEKLGIDHDHGVNFMQNRSLTDEIKRLLRGFNETLELVERINASGSFSETLNDIYSSFSQYLPYTYIGIALLKEDDPTVIVASYGIGDEHHPGLAKELLHYEAALHETSLGLIMETNKPRVINDLDAYFKNNEMRDYSSIIMRHGIKSSITLPLRANEMPLGFIFFSSNQKNVYQDKHIEYLKLISNSIALSFEKNIFSEELVYSSVLALAKLSEARDEDTGEHLMRMSHYVGVIAEALSETERFKTVIDQNFISNIVKFSPMHDIGKVGVPDSVLLKPGKLTAEEFEIMKFHTIYGANVLNEAERNVRRSGRSLFQMGISIALNHHEKYDGSGYPNGLRGEEIPLEARIVTIADVFDALLSKRPYKEPFTMEETLRIINEGRGKHFDPFIIDVFNENLDRLMTLQHLYL